MRIKNKEFKAVVCTPAIGKSYICDNYKEFVDVDELRLFTKYKIPLPISRQELEKTKGNRPFEKIENYEENFYNKLKELLNSNKILICSPHKEIKEFLIKNKVPYLFVYPKLSMQKEIYMRMKNRGNNEAFIKENDDLYKKFYKENTLEPFAIVKYRIKKGEYLKDVLEKAGYKFNEKE